MIGRWAGRGRWSRDRWRRHRSADQQGLTGEAEASSGVVDDVDLADVEAGVEPVKGNVKGKSDGIASGHVYAGGLDQRGLEYLCGPL